MDLEKIRELLDELAAFMKENNLAELDLNVNGAEVKLRKVGSQVQQQVIAHTTSLAPTAPQPPLPGAPPPDELELEPGTVALTSPMVGTFYRAPKADSDAFAEVGDDVHEDQVLCIIEAMKVMNEIKAEHRGRVARILVENGEPVEYGQQLMLIAVGE